MVNISISKLDLDLIVSAQRALFCRMSKNIKAIYSTMENQKLTWIVYFDKEPSEEEIELQRISTTEIVCDFPQIMAVEKQFIHHPLPINRYKTNYYNWIYTRYDALIHE